MLRDIFRLGAVIRLGIVTLNIISKNVVMHSVIMSCDIILSFIMLFDINLGIFRLIAVLSPRLFLVAEYH
jgi:hypothetical protein